MGKNKTDVVLSNVYNKHARGGRYNSTHETEQVMTEQIYIRLLSELAANRFQWVGLPDTVDARFLELTLLKRAVSVFYFDRDAGQYFALEATGAGRINMYDNPTSFTVTSPLFSKTLSHKNCVPIYANFLRIPDWDIILTYARRLAAIDRTIDITIENLRRTKIIVTDENQRHTWTNLIQQQRSGAPIILARKGINAQEAVQDIGLDVHHDLLPNLMIARSRIWNDCMTLLGINNANQEKKERLVKGEVEANDSQINSTKAIALNSRKMAAAAINRMFDMTVSVHFNEDINFDSVGTGDII